MKMAAVHPITQKRGREGHQAKGAMGTPAVQSRARLKDPAEETEAGEPEGEGREEAEGGRFWKVAENVQCSEKREVRSAGNGKMPSGLGHVALALAGAMPGRAKASVPRRHGLW